MDKIDILLWIMSGGLTIILAVMARGFSFVFKEIKEIHRELKEMKQDIHQLDKRMYGIETVLHMKDCCVLNNDQKMKKAE